MAALPRRWDELAWTDFASLPRDAVAILPVAATEQHGPHLPLRVDAALNEAILARALELAPAELPLLALPMQAVGHSPEHARFPGTLTLRAETTLALWEDIGASVARAGVRKLVVFNSHGGQPQLVDILCTRLRAAHGMFAVAASWFRLHRHDPAEAVLPEAERRWGIHAGAIETAMMRHLHPGQVREGGIGDFSPRWAAREGDFAQLAPHGDVGFGWETQDLGASGAVGDARLGDAELGGRIVAQAAAALAALLQEVHRFDAAAYLREGPLAR